MSEFRWWEYTHEQRQRFAKRGRETAMRRHKIVAERYGPKIHALRIAGLSWGSVADRLVMDYRTAQKRYNLWLKNHPELVQVSITDTKKHVAWNLCKDYKQAEVAEMMKVPLSTIKSWVRRWSEDQDQKYVSSVPGWPLSDFNPDIVPQPSPDDPRPSGGEND